jgi:hypothetical protein
VVDAWSQGTVRTRARVPSAVVTHPTRRRRQRLQSRRLASLSSHTPRVAPRFHTPGMTRWPLAFLGTATLVFGASAGAASPRALEWKRGAPLPLPRSEVAAATVGRELVVVGGFLANGNSSGGSTPIRRPATAGAGCPTSRRGQPRDGRLRRTQALRRRRLRRAHACLCPLAGRWRRLPDLPEPRAAAARRSSAGRSTWSAVSRGWPCPARARVRSDPPPLEQIRARSRASTSA